ncbi:rhomboid family intramembrane serine protease [Nesterenkonia sp.]|uniref:rhomboid family intramembrane serine protease n=1 Tax=Nesterenkonia sp. TaxID=704201 RepID=UPI0026021425|nr:rhomboid family intramembrane serine protease [Nesterenkonia sp.]
MIQAPVGFHCPVCLKQAQRARPVQRTRYGARTGSDRPMVTYAAIALCAVVYLLQLAAVYLPSPLGQAPDVTGLFAYAPVYTAAWYPDPEPWRMLTSAVLHSPSSAIHILFNMMALWFIGRVVEPAVGGLRFAALLVLSALGGSVAVMYLSDPWVHTVGASGAVFGLFGALFILLRSSGAQTGGLVALVAVNMVIGFMPGLNISWQGHLGGLLTGLLCAGIIAYAPRGRLRGLWQACGLAGVGVLLLAAAWAGSGLVSPYESILL